ERRAAPAEWVAAFHFFIFIYEGHFHEDIAALDPVLFACGRNRPAKFPAGSCPDAPFARRVDPAVFRESNGDGRSDLQRVIPDQVPEARLDPGGRADDGGGSASQEQAAAGSFLRHESAAVPGGQLSRRLQFFQYSDATGQSLRGFVVVPQ